MRVLPAVGRQIDELVRYAIAYMEVYRPYIVSLCLQFPDQLPDVTPPIDGELRRLDRFVVGVEVVLGRMHNYPPPNGHKRGCS